MSHWLMAPRGIGPLRAPRSRPPLPPTAVLNRLVGALTRPRPAGSGVVLPFACPRPRVRVFRQRPEQP